MESLKSQYLLAEDIEQEYINYKKDGSSRKNNAEYFKRRWNRLEELWNEFQFKHDQLCAEVSRTDPYFMDQIYEKIKTTYLKFKNQINEEYQSFTAQASTSQEKPRGTETTGKPLEIQNTADQPTSQPLQTGSTVDKGIYSKMDETLRRQQANFKAFTRTMANFNLDELSEKWEFEDALKTLETRWSAIDALHLEIDSELDGKNLEYESKFTKYEIQYHTLKRNINKKMWSVSYREKFTPKLDIPIFNGNVTQWVSFKDLFSEAIHNNPTISNGQKMQLLKSKVKGEAERLIQHLTISSDNYLTCWEILNHRYNNKRLIFTSQINILFNLPVIQQQSLTQIKKMHDVTVETLHAIKNLGVDITTWDPLLVIMLSQKLDSESYTHYMESVKNPRELPILQELLDFLESKFTTLETSARRKQEVPVQKTNNSQTTSSNMKKPNFNKQYQNNRDSYEHLRIGKTYHMSGYIVCPLCENSHGIYQCRNFLHMPDDKKLSTVNKLGLCINCLFSHNNQPCNSTKTCRKCQNQHNTLIHDALEKIKSSVPKSTSGATIATSADPGPSNSHVSQVECPEVLLGTAQLKVLGADGTYHNMRALIDQGSQISLITEHAAQTLGIKRQKCKGVIYGVGQRENNCKGKINISCVSLHNNYTFNAEVIIMSHLIKNLPNKTFAKPNWTIFQNIQLADPEFYISRPVDLLLGADIYSNIILSGMIKGDSVTQPIAQQTQLGWLLCGSVPRFHCNVILNNMEDMQQFWEIEDVMDEEDLSSEDIQCLEYFNQTTKRKEDGRYEVRLPMKPNFQNELGFSKTKALAQFRNIEQKFRKQENLAIAYRTFMQEYQDLNHMKLDNNQSTSLEYYLPHHGIERAESSTTKYRVVFNASSKTSTGCSLNDLMFKGPNLQQDLQTLLLKWRQFPYAFTADIEKMYRQILVTETDQSLQKIVWRQSPEHPVQTFKLATVTYGTKAAPFLAMMTLRKLAADERNNYKDVSKILEESFYMDDLVYGAYSVEHGRKTVDDLMKLLQRGGFNLRKWSTNKPEILQNLTNQQNSGNNMIFNFKTDNISKTLGLCWNPNNDKFTFKCKMSTETTKLTKRTLLSEISKIFDPLGWLAPVVTKMKLLFQTVWKTNIKWDEQVSDNIYQEWSRLRSEINILNEIELPRWILCNEHDVIELHGFCDASQKAYAGVVYARIKRQKQVVLVAAKTKLVPLNKTLTLPRLELCGAHLLSNLINKIKLALHHHELVVYGWTDSKVVIGWLQGEASRWKPFVANRVQKITQIMPEQQWHYVNTTENPADAASRGIYPSQLRDHSLWWSAPSWISTFQGEVITKQSFETDEEKKLGQSNIVQQTQEENIISKLLTKYSNFAKVIRIVARIRKILIYKQNQQSTYLTFHELRNAKLTIIKNIQKNELRSEIEHIRKHGKVHSNSKLFNLNPFVDKDNILRVGGRLSQANINMEMKHPKIIPPESRLAVLLIDQAHKLTFHGGPRLTLGYLRQEYWITGGYNYVKKQLRKCVTCRKHEGRTQQPLMGDLPAARVNPAYPFYHTGVDYTGSVEVKYNKGRGAKTTKGYIAIFVCMVTKAVHLELVSEMTSSAFLAALRRMAARRGAPQHLYSDNGTNFVGANKILQQEWQQLQRTFDENFLAEIAEMNIDWHFNAPAWPSAGGLWERAVRSLKHHLRRVVGVQKLTFEEYSTILAQLEACLNSRPLCALTEHIEDLNFLTPAHFLTGRSGVTIIETSEDARTRWHLSQKLLKDIWKRWKSEYLTQLTARQKWQTPKENIKIGDMVVIHEDNLPPGKWALGRVIESHSGSDGYVRVVTLKTKNGYTKRPVIKLSILPLECQTKTIN